MATALLVCAPLAAQGFDDVQITSTHVAGSVHMLEGRGGNIGASVGEDGILIVDDQFEPLAEKIRQALREIDSGGLEFILNTHWHGDHTGSNEVFGSEGTIIAHTNVRKRLSSEQSLFGNTVPASPPEAWPVITFDESLSIHFNGEEIRAIHLPRGHTDGDSIILFTGSNVLHMGDHFFRDRFPFVDLQAGGNVLGYLDNVAKAIEMAPEGVKVIPGHGPLSTVEDLENFHRVLTETVEIVRGRMQDGKNLGEIRAEGLPAKYAQWGTGFINTGQWLEIVYRSLIR